MWLNNLRFVDHVALISQSNRELQEIVKEFEDMISNAGLKRKENSSSHKSGLEKSKNEKLVWMELFISYKH